MCMQSDGKIQVCPKHLEYLGLEPSHKMWVSVAHYHLLNIPLLHHISHAHLDGFLSWAILHPWNAGYILR